MGHLINPISFRMGWSSSWEDVWFIKHLYYPEFLHIILKTRLLLVFIFNFDFFEGSFIYSHFFIYKKYKRLIISIFFYCGKIEQIIDNVIVNSWSFYRQGSYSYIFNRFIKKPKWFFKMSQILFIFHIFTGFDLDIWPVDKIENFLSIVAAFDFNSLNILFKSRSFSHLSLNLRNCFILIVFLYYSVFVQDSLVNECNYEEVFRTFSLSFFKHVSLGTFFSIVAQYFSSIFTRLFSGVSFLINFFLISNDDVTARFLSRYIASKLYLGFRLWELLKPIRIELKIISLSQLIYDKKKSFGRLSLFDKNNIYLGVFKRVLFLFFSIYIKYFFLSYKRLKIWFSFDSFILYFWFLNSLSLNFSRLIGLSKNFIKKKAGFSLFFNIDSLFLNKLFFPVFITLNFERIKQSINLFLWFDKIFKDIYCCNFIFFWHSSIFVEQNIVYLFNYFFNEFVKFSFYSCNFKWLINLNNLNKLKLRNVHSGVLLHSTSLLGFKFHFSGRFSRRQKASSWWYRSGSLPLNSIDAKIDYSFFTVPLMNSALTVKVWLYYNNSYVCSPGFQLS